MRAPNSELYLSFSHIYNDETSLCVGFERQYKLVLEVGGADWKNVGNAAVLAGNSSVTLSWQKTPIPAGEHFKLKKKHFVVLILIINVIITTLRPGKNINYNLHTLWKISGNYKVPSRLQPSLKAVLYLRSDCLVFCTFENRLWKIISTRFSVSWEIIFSDNLFSLRAVSGLGEDDEDQLDRTSKPFSAVSPGTPDKQVSQVISNNRAE